jgi:hypothetical protein
MSPLGRTALTAAVMAAVGLLCLPCAVAAGEPVSDTPTTPTITMVPELSAPEGRMHFVDIVGVKLRSGTLPEAVGRACTMIAVSGTVTAVLQSPVGNRAVLSIT